MAPDQESVLSMGRGRIGRHVIRPVSCPRNLVLPNRTIVLMNMRQSLLGLATSPGTCAGTCGFIRGKTCANRSPTYKSPSAYKTREFGCQFWITYNLYGLPVQPVYALVSIHVLQQQRGAWAVSKMKWDENRTHDGKFRPDNVNH